MWNLEKNKSKIAMIDELGNTVHYNDIIELERKLSKYLKKADIILCLCENTISSIMGYLTFIELHSIPILLEKSISDVQIEKINDNYELNYIWAPIERKFNHFYRCFTYMQYSLWKNKNYKEHKIHLDLALLLSTSGSMGFNKMIKLSYKNIKENAHSIIKYLHITEFERPITVLPMCYAYGLSIINSHIMSGATILVTHKSILDKKFWNMVTQYKATSFSGVPYTYQILEKIRFRDQKFPYLKTLTQAGGKLPDELQQLYANYSIHNKKNFFIMYGQSEATARMTFLSPYYADKKIGSVGKAIQNGKVLLVDDSGEKIKESYKVGEIEYHGPNVMMGYSNNILDLKIGDIQGEKLLTGDLGYFDEDNFLYIVGRKKRIIKIFGRRISLDELEEYIRNKSDIECVCIEKNEKIMVYLEKLKNKNTINKILIDELKFPKQKFEICFIKEFPRNESGKIQYTKF